MDTSRRYASTRRRQSRRASGSDRRGDLTAIIERSFTDGVGELIKRGIATFFANAQSSISKAIDQKQIEIQRQEELVRRRLMEAAQIVLTKEQMLNREKAELDRQTKDPIRAAYRLLGVNEGDPVDLIKSVYKAKAKHLHPDTATGDKEAFQRLEAAYSAVMDDLRKRGRA